MVERVRRIMRSRVPCRIWIGIFFTWHSSEHSCHLMSSGNRRTRFEEQRTRPIEVAEDTQGCSLLLVNRRCASNQRRNHLLGPSKVDQNRATTGSCCYFSGMLLVEEDHFRCEFLNGEISVNNGLHLSGIEQIVPEG